MHRVITRTVTYLDKAQADIASIFTFYLRYMDANRANQRTQDILDEIEVLADNTMLGTRVRDMNTPTLYWYVSKTDYKVYFRRGLATCEVLRVWPSRSKPLTPDEIEP